MTETGNIVTREARQDRADPTAARLCVSRFRKCAWRDPAAACDMASIHLELRRTSPYAEPRRLRLWPKSRTGEARQQNWQRRTDRPTGFRPSSPRWCDRPPFESRLPAATPRGSATTQ